jgi:hypothetical protein
LRHRSPPRTENFPALPDLTEEIEAEAFEYVDDSGWEMEQYQQFFRLFYRADERVQTAVCLVEQQDIAFFYVALSSREKNGTLWTTWNYPFSYSLQFAPQWRMNRLRGDLDFVQMLESHREFLRRMRSSWRHSPRWSPTRCPRNCRRTSADQIAHNLATGVLVRRRPAKCVYSWARPVLPVAAVLARLGPAFLSLRLVYSCVCMRLCARLQCSSLFHR